MSNDDDGSIGCFGGTDNDITAVSNLRNTTWSRRNLGEGKGLDRVDNNKIEIPCLDGLGDVIGGATAGELELVRRGTETNGTEFDRSEERRVGKECRL